MRAVYQCLVQLHPYKFRSRFGDEMLWIFDEVRSPADRYSLIHDAFLSLFRQWVWRHHVDLIELTRVTMDALLLPLIITVNLAVLGQLVAFSIVGSPAIVNVNQLTAIAFASALCLGLLATLRSLILRHRPAMYVWLKLNYM